MNKHPLLRYLFIASLISIFFQLGSGIFSIAKDPTSSILSQADKIRDVNPDIARKMEELAYEVQTNKYFQVMPYINLLFLLFSLLSVVMMWQLNKNGWYLYVFAEISPHLLTLIRWGDYVKYYTLMSGTNYYAVIYILITLAFDILFIGLYWYALNKSSNHSRNDTSQLTG